MRSFWALAVLAAVILRGTRTAPTAHTPASMKFGDEDNLVISIVTNGSYQIILSGKVWMNSGPVAVRNDGKWQSSEPELKTLVLRNTTANNGEDAWGAFQTTQFWWSSPNGAFNFLTDINVYTDLPVITFTQTFLNGVKNASVSSDEALVMSSFPTFLEEDLGLDRGYMTYSGTFAAHVQTGRWSSDGKIYQNVDGGLPLVVFDQDMKNTIVISPMNSFMAASQATWMPMNNKSYALGFGLLNTIDEVPPGYTYKTVLVAGQNVTGTMATWGRLLRKFYGKPESYRRRDFSINYLGYYTDNGACYYYSTGPYANYEEAMIAVYEDSVKNNIPYRYLQLDSWWYFKGDADGVKNWTAMPSVFPNGIEAVVEKTGWPIIGHNRYWSGNTDYATQNGGKYKFIVDGSYALPNDTGFWKFLLSSSQTQWNLWVYEQDWLDVTNMHVSQLQADLFLGQTWLREMGQAAEELGMTVQYCMAWPRHVLESVEIPAVTQIRVSGDYGPGNTQWRIGDTTILAHAVGLAAFKDDFHTTSHQDTCRFKSDEPYPELETYVASLSGGPVGPSDTVGGVNRTLLMSTCMSDGRLLKPTRPVMSIDATFVHRAFGTGGADGQLYAAYTEMNGWTWYHILAADMVSDYTLVPADLPPSSSTFPASSFPGMLAFTYRIDGVVTSVTEFSDKKPLAVPKCGRSDFRYWVVAPVIPYLNIALLGDLTKVISMSETRFTQISDDGGYFYIDMQGVPGEIVVVSVYDTSSKVVKKAGCTISPSGLAQLQLPDLICSQ